MTSHRSNVITSDNQIIFPQNHLHLVPKGPCGPWPLRKHDDDGGGGDGDEGVHVGVDDAGGGRVAQPPSGRLRPN